MHEPQRLILDLLSPVADIAQARLDRFDAEGWEAVDELARRQRLKPLLHWMVTRHHAGLVLPGEVIADWEGHRHKSQMKSLTNLAELLRVTTALEQAGIACLALKGAYLAYFAYPEANLRPMRDIDIVVPHDRLRDAFDTLLRHGARRIDQSGGDAGIDAALEINVKHLPPLLSPGGNVMIEIHNYLFNIEVSLIQKTCPEMSRDEGFWDRKISRDVNGRTICFYSHEDLLIHLAVHAAHDHKFDNGPLLLSDIAFLVKSHALDWDAFWATAERLEKAPACLLALRLAETFWGELGVGYTTPHHRAVEADLLHHAQSLMFYDIQNKFARNLSLHLNENATILGKLKYLASRIFRPRAQVAAIFQINPRSPIVLFYYPVLYGKLVARFMNTVMNSRLRKFETPQAVAEIESINAFLGAR